MSEKSEVVGHFELDSAATLRAAEELGEAWKRFEATLIDAVIRAGGSVSAEIALPATPRERVIVNRKGLDRIYSRALITLTVRESMSKKDLQFELRFGVSGAKGTFYPRPESGEIENLVRSLRSLRNFVVWFGGGQAFVDAVFSASKTAFE